MRQKIVKQSNKDLSNNAGRLMCKIKKLAQKIERNRSKGYTTEKLIATFEQKRTMLEAKGVKIKDYAMFTV